MTRGNLSRTTILGRSTVVALLVGIAVVTLGLSPLVVGTAHATAVTCGQTLDSGDFVLEADLGPCDDPSGAAALTISGSSTTPATLDMAGFSIICQDLNGKKGVPVGIMITGDSVTVSNGKIVGCKIGVQVAGTGNHLVKAVTSEGSTSSGFVITGDKNRIKSATARAGAADGFVVKGSNNLISRSIASDNAQAGFNVSGGHNRVKLSTSGGNEQSGFTLSGSHNKLAQNSAESNNGSGFAVGGDRNTAGGNTATTNGDAGYQVTANKSKVTANTATGNTGDGITLVGSANKVTGNTADDNGGNGLAVAITSSLNKLVDNIASANGQVGITVSGLSNLIKGSEALANTVLDLEDTNPNCDNNKWKSNTFSTSSQACIK